MDMTFESVMPLTRTVSSSAAFEDNECEAYYNILASLAPTNLIVEVGLQFGRSSSVALQVAKEFNLRYHGIDPFVEGKEPYAAWMKMATDIGKQFRLSLMRSQDVVMHEFIDVVLIDGDHSYETVLHDAIHYLSHVVTGGYALFHDYQRESLPDVTRAVDTYFTDKVGVAYPYTWRHIDTVGTLGIWRRM